MMLHCLFLLFSTMLGDSFQDAITTASNVEHVSEGSSAVLSCNYTGDALNLQWYRQHPRSKPEFLILIYGGGDPEKTEGRFTVKHEKANKRVHLELPSAEVTDSALYYCALQPTVTGNPYTLYKNLTAHERRQVPNFV
ncbi:hypothetical protein AAFF_G00239610 [Aldrovandia affinis]|uniref:Ig-like domain-containing protein n=1 Tax=Aldrovandia affinis TaxID=143900 RepID=A0AAD7RE29_9TELE|nr:hypothetical protein AAFF_G00239610 [Aldrovandia affinis]